jgi:hypothetical protein
MNDISFFKQLPPDKIISNNIYLPEYQNITKGMDKSNPYLSLITD